MTDKKPTLKLKLSGEALLKLQAKIPKPRPQEPKRAEIFIGKDGKVSDNNALNRAQAKKEAVVKAKEKTITKALAPKTEEAKYLESRLDLKQYFNILKALQKGNSKTFPPKEKPARALAIGIHKDIAKVFKISIKKAFYFCRMYCGTKRYKEAISQSGVPRYNLKGKKVGKVD